MFVAGLRHHSPAPYAERAKMAYETGKRIARDGARRSLDAEPNPDKAAFENAIVVNSAIGGIHQLPSAHHRDRSVMPSVELRHRRLG